MVTFPGFPRSSYFNIIVRFVIRSRGVLIIYRPRKPSDCHDVHLIRVPHLTNRYGLTIQIERCIYILQKWVREGRTHAPLGAIGSYCSNKNPTARGIQLPDQPCNGDIDGRVVVRITAYGKAYCHGVAAVQTSILAVYREWWSWRHRKIRREP
jgi:hypothetical protein